MDPAEFLSLVWILAPVQLLGLASAFSVRLSIGTRHQRVCQAIYFALLAVVGVATTCSVDHGAWPLWGTTLALMVVSAIFEARGPEALAREAS